MALEGMNFGKSRLEIKAEIKDREDQNAGPKFNFKTTKRAEGTVDLRSDVAQYLETMPKDRAVDIWKVYFIRKIHTVEQAANYKEICKYLTQKYGIDIPKRK